MQQCQASTTEALLITHREYNARGQLVRQWQNSGETAKAPTLYEYDSFGNMVKQTLALAEEPTSSNSLITVFAYTIESAEDGVFSITTHTRYNAEGAALNTTQKELMSQLSATLAEKTIVINERGLISVDWTVYNNGTKRTRCSSVPTSDITAVVNLVFALRRGDDDGFLHDLGMRKEMLC